MKTLETHSLTLAFEVDTENDSANPQWVQLFGVGKQVAKDGRWWNLSNPSSVIEHSLKLAGDTDLVVDYEHQTDFANTNGKPAPAAGWIKELQNRDDGIWALVQWTEKAAEMIANKEYRYLSPTFEAHVKTFEVTRISRAALTNRPALNLTALATEEVENATDDLPDIFELLGVKSDATTEQLLVAAVKKIFSLENQLNAKKENNPEMASELKTAMSEMAQEREKMEQDRIKSKVDNCVSSGVFPPSMRQWGLNMAQNNEQDFDDFVTSVGKPFAYLFEKSVIPAETMNKYSKGNQASSDRSAEAAVAKQLGIDPKSLT